MSRTSATFSVSLPPAMASELERVRRKEHRTRSELVREALLHYIRVADARSVQERIARLPEEEPAVEEIAAIEQGSKEFRAGKFIDLGQLRHELGRSGQQPRPKKSQARPRR
jgi:metal-responsive CopG/Arc/MetJ family transcriptional regulator